MNAKTLALVFASFVAIGLVWAVAMPLNAAPDEDQHMIWAASTARLQLEPEGASGERTLNAPDGLYMERCWQWQPWLPVTCQFHIDVDPVGDFRNTPVRGAIPYYAVVGATSLVAPDGAAPYVMRFTNVALVAAVLTLGVWSMSARRPTPGSIAMATVAFTPMLAFLLGTVNPSGVAIAGGFALWSAGLFLAGSDRPLGLRLAALGVPAVAMLVTRRDAIVYLAVIAVILALHAGPSRLRAKLREPVVRRAAIAVPVVVGLAFVLGGNTLVRWFQDRSGDDAGSASEALGRLPLYVDHMIGVLGWVDTFMPSPVVMGWYGLIAIAIVVSVGVSRRDGAAVAAVAACTLVIPFLFGLLHQLFYFQGRYALPLAVGIPVIASAALTTRRVTPLITAAMARTIVWVVAVLSSVAFAVALRRFTVGDHGSWTDMFFDPAWTPRLPALVLVAVYGALMAGLAVALSRLIGHYDGDEPATNDPPLAAANPS